MEYVSFSSALQEVIIIIYILKDLRHDGLHLHSSILIDKYCTFENIMSCVKMANNDKRRPHTKHLSIRLNDFISHIIKRIITMDHISTKEQSANIFTKALPKEQFCNLKEVPSCHGGKPHKSLLFLLLIESTIYQ